MAKVLIADDTVEIRQLIEVVLQADEHSALHANDGAEALDLAASNDPDLIVMDYDMSPMDGLEATQRLKSSALTTHIPIIGISAGITKQKREEMVAAGCDVFLQKPFTITRLRAAMARFLNGTAVRHAG